MFWGLPTLQADQTLRLAKQIPTSPENVREAAATLVRAGCSVESMRRRLLSYKFTNGEVDDLVAAAYPP